MLGPFEDGELEPHEMQEVARHLAECGACEKILGEFAFIGRELRDLTVAPALEGFAERVDARVRSLRAPWRERIERFFDRIGEQLGSAMAVGAIAGAVAIVTAVVITPYVRQHLNPGLQGAALAPVSAGSQAKAESATAEIASAQPAAETGSGQDHAVISRLEAEMPSVAVWSEPQNDTTVIWLPEQQP